MEIILDISANTHKNDIAYFNRMMREIADIDNHKHTIIIKGQLFEEGGVNIRQDLKMFDAMYYLTKGAGYKLTASVFDLPSLKFLLGYNVPFVKIANNRKLDWLVGEIPRKIPVYRSVSDFSITGKDENWLNANLACVSKYPASISDYRVAFGLNAPIYCLSDHTIGIELFEQHKDTLEIYECHFALEDSTGLDAGPWAKRPNELKEMLNV